MTGAVETAVPTVLWAERSDKVYITIEVTDCAKEATAVSVDPSGKLSFRGRSGGGQAYALELQLCKPVDAEATKIAVTPRAVLLVVHKAGDDAASGKRWGRLLAAPGKPPHYVKVDWSKYVDEDEEAAEADKDPMAGFGGFGGAGGMGNFDLSSLESMKARQLRGKAPKIGRERLVSPLFQTQNFGGGGGGGGMGGDEEKDDSDDEDDMPGLAKP